MWKFIIFILIVAVAVWQINNLAFDDNGQADVEQKVVEKTERKTKTAVAEKSPEESTQSTLRVSALQGALKGIEQTQELEAFEEEPVKKETAPQQAVEKKEQQKTEANSYEAMLSGEAETEDFGKNVNTVTVEGGGGLGALVQQAPKEEVISLSDDDKKAQLDALKSLASTTEEVKETAEKSRPVLADTDKGSIRENLQKLLASAEQAIETEDAKELLDADSLEMKNSVQGQTKTSKELLHDLVAQATQSTGDRNTDQFVSNLLKEVSASTIRVLEVQEGFTTVMVKSGDTLSGLADKIYGDPGKYMLIYQANKDVISNPNQIFAGMVLKMPRE